MDTSAIGDIYTRLTRAEARLEVHVAELSARIETLERAEQQRQAERRQAEQQQADELRQRVERLQEIIKADKARRVTVGAENTETD